MKNAFQFKLIDAIFQRNELVKKHHVYSVLVSPQSATGLMESVLWHRPASAMYMYKVDHFVHVRTA